MLPPVLGCSTVGQKVGMQRCHLLGSKSCPHQRSILFTQGNLFVFLLSSSLLPTPRFHCSLLNTRCHTCPLFGLHASRTSLQSLLLLQSFKTHKGTCFTLWPWLSVLPLHLLQSKASLRHSPESILLKVMMSSMLLNLILYSNSSSWHTGNFSCNCSLSPCFPLGFHYTTLSCFSSHLQWLLLLNLCLFFLFPPLHFLMLECPRAWSLVPPSFILIPLWSYPVPWFLHLSSYHISTCLPPLFQTIIYSQNLPWRSSVFHVETRLLKVWSQEKAGRLVMLLLLSYQQRKWEVVMLWIHFEGRDNQIY